MRLQLETEREQARLQKASLGALQLKAARQIAIIESGGLQDADDGVGLPRDWRMERSSGHGLRVTRERLSALYPESGEQRLAMHRRKGGGTAVTILIPLHRVGTERHGIVA